MIKNIFIIENNIIVNKIVVDEAFDLSQVEYIDESNEVVVDIGYVYDEQSQTFMPPEEPTLDQLLNQASSVDSVQLQQQLDQIISSL